MIDDHDAVAEGVAEQRPLGDGFDAIDPVEAAQATRQLEQRFPQLSDIADWTWLPQPRTPCRDAVTGYIERAGLRLVQLHGVRPDPMGSGLWSCTCADGYDCPRPGKHPVYPRWFDDCPGGDAHALIKWYARHPVHNVGIETGWRTRLFVLDIDPRNAGFESLARLEEKHGKLPRTLTVRTPSGGRHFYFFVPNGWSVPPTSIGKLGPGIDVICDGRKYVVAPPSRTGGGNYEWEISR